MKLPFLLLALTTTAASGSKLTLTWSSRNAAWMNIISDATAHTPAANPSRPSSQLTVLIMPMNQKIVSPKMTGQGNTICPLGDAALGPVQSSIKLFREEYMEHIRQGRCPAGHN